jgi:hypothetical protein
VFYDFLHLAVKHLRFILPLYFIRNANLWYLEISVFVSPEILEPIDGFSHVIWYEHYATRSHPTLILLILYCQ